MIYILPIIQSELGQGIKLQQRLIRRGSIPYMEQGVQSLYFERTSACMPIQSCPVLK